MTSCRFGEFELDGARFELRRAGRRVAVQPKVLKLLFYLVAERARAPAVEELLAQVWPRETVTHASVRRAIRGVRRVLGDSGDSQTYVRTVRARGYQFVPAVEPCPPAPETPERTHSFQSRDVAVQSPDVAFQSVDVAGTTQLALSGLPRLRPRRACSAELVRFSAQQGAPRLLTRGCLAQIQEGLELGDLGSVDSAIASLEAQARGQREPLLQWYVELFRTMRATIRGQFAQAELLALGALQIGQRAANAAEAALHAYGIQIVWIYVQQGRLEEAEQLVGAYCRQHPTVTACHTALACIEVALGRPRDLHKDLERTFGMLSSADGLTPFQVSDFAPAVELCVRAREPAWLRMLYQLLVPLAGEHGVVSLGLATHGPIAKQLGMVAAALGDFDQAREHFEYALEQTSRMPSPPLLALVQCEYATMLCAEEAYGRGGQVARRRRLASEALETARLLGMRHIAARCVAMSGRPQHPGGWSAHAAAHD